MNDSVQLFVTAEGPGSLIDFSSLETFLDSSRADHTPTGPDFEGTSSITVSTGATIQADALARLSAVQLNLDGTGTLPIEQIESFTNGVMVLSGSRYVFANLMNLENTSVTLKTEHAIFEKASNINGASLVVEQGGELTLAAAESYSNSIDDRWIADGAGSLLSLPSLLSIKNGTGDNHDMTITARIGGKINLGSVSQIVDPAEGDTDNRGVFVTADGPQSEVDLSSLVSFTDAGADQQSSITANNFGTVIIGNSTLLENVTTNETNNGRILGPEPAATGRPPRAPLPVGLVPQPAAAPAPSHVDPVTADATATAFVEDDVNDQMNVLAGVAKSLNFLPTKARDTKLRRFSGICESLVDEPLAQPSDMHFAAGPLESEADTERPLKAADSAACDVAKLVIANIGNDQLADDVFARMDVNEDGFVSPLDALLVINTIQVDSE